MDYYINKKKPHCIDMISYDTGWKELIFSKWNSNGEEEDIYTELAIIDCVITDEGVISYISLMEFDQLLENIESFELPDIGIFEFENNIYTFTELVRFALKNLTSYSHKLEEVLT